MKFIIGLGNPGVRYQKTRHNIGRALIEFIAETEKAIFKRDNKMKAMCAQVRWGIEDIRLVYPEVFMNLSGETLGRIQSYYTIGVSTDLLVVVDDAALPFGMLRLRPQGSSGGHNGLKSIASALGSEQYARLRLGIGMPGLSGTDSDSDQSAIAMQDYVLACFSDSEMKGMMTFYKSAYEACRLWVEGPVERAMNAVNQRVSKG